MRAFLKINQLNESVSAHSDRPSLGGLHAFHHYQNTICKLTWTPSAEVLSDMFLDYHFAMWSQCVARALDCVPHALAYS